MFQHLKQPMAGLPIRRRTSPPTSFSPRPRYLAYPPLLDELGPGEYARSDEMDETWAAAPSPEDPDLDDREWKLHLGGREGAT
jgi:hypothetical protein